MGETVRSVLTEALQFAERERRDRQVYRHTLVAVLCVGMAIGTSISAAVLAVVVLIRG